MKYIFVALNFNIFKVGENEPDTLGFCATPYDLDRYIKSVLTLSDMKLLSIQSPKAIKHGCKNVTENYIMCVISDFYSCFWW